MFTFYFLIFAIILVPCFYFGFVSVLFFELYQKRKALHQHAHQMIFFNKKEKKLFIKSNIKKNHLEYRRAFY